jgi:outer membrane protein OmpA-like peptidoglycan-associated protein
MPRRSVQQAIAALVVLATAASTFAQAPTDDPMKGGSDHPLVSRFPGARLVGYAQLPYDEVRIPAGPSPDLSKGFEKTFTIEGKLTRLAYHFPPDRSAVEVFRNYQAAIGRAGLQVVYSCVKETCGRGFGAAMFFRHVQHGVSWAVTSTSPMPFNYGREPRYLLATGTRADRTRVVVAVYVVPPKETSFPAGGIFVEVVDAQPLDLGQVSVNLDAGELDRVITAEGRATLYGIYFDNGRSELKPESRPQLEEMAKLLARNPALKVFVVGHTDGRGELAANLELSQARAEAVVRALVSEYRVDAAKLTARGVASLTPVASNRDEAGRARNRRVELVER